MSGATTAVSIGVTALSIAGQFVQARQQADAQKSAAAYNAQVAGNEAATHRQLAQNEIARGIADRERQQRQAARAMGEMRATMGASGFEMDSGSPLVLLGESAAEHQYDSGIITRNAEQAAWQHQAGVTAANNNRAYAAWQGRQASSGDLGTHLAMGGTLLGGVSKVVRGSRGTY